MDSVYVEMGIIRMVEIVAPVLINVRHAQGQVKMSVSLVKLVHFYNTESVFNNANWLDIQIKIAMSVIVRLLQVYYPQLLECSKIELDSYGPSEKV